MGPLIFGPENGYFRLSVSLVAPAAEEYSPPDSEVGMLIMGISEGLAWRCSDALRADKDFNPSGVETELAIA